MYVELLISYFMFSKVFLYHNIISCNSFMYIGQCHLYVACFSLVSRRQFIKSKNFCLFSSGDVRVNWSLVTKSGATLKDGDVVSVSGMGRLKVKAIPGYFLCV